MTILAIILGIVVILVVAQDAFETVVLPRRVTRRIRITRLFYRALQVGWKYIGRMAPLSASREAILGYSGPLSLLALIALWAVLFVFGFALLLWGLAVPLNSTDQAVHFTTYLYLSGTTFFTLGLGDITPQPGVARFLVVSEVGLGFIFLALVISYVPVIYQAFSRRELRIAILDSRAGSPATAVEMLRRNHAGKNVEELNLLLHEWEIWCADILESHLSYPVLAYYRSQHQSQSWVAALTVILDTCALVLTGIQGIPPQAARFAFAMARHAVVDLAQVLDTPPVTGPGRLSPAGFARLHEVLQVCAIHLEENPTAEQKLADLRETYEPFVIALAERLLVSLPPWIPPVDSLDDWQTTAWDDMFPGTARTLLEVMHPQEPGLKPPNP